MTADVTPPPPSLDVCKRLEGAAATEIDPRVQLSRAYALARWFAIVRGDVDNALHEGTAPPSGAVQAFGQANGRCVVASAGALGPASASRLGNVVVLRPGTGPLLVDQDAEAVAVDLRDLPSGRELEDALVALLPSLVAGPHAWPSAEDVRCAGMPDEIFARGTSSSFYGCEVVEEPVQAPTLGTSRARPLAIITGPRLAPEAALFAASLRLAGKAWLVGEDLLTEVAESTAAPGPSQTVYVRTHVLRQDGAWMPDVIAADHRTETPAAWLASLSERGGPPPLTATSTDRTTIVSVPPLHDASTSRVDAAATRAALVAAHAAARTFFPYFGTIPDRWDAALRETWPRANVSSAREQLALLGTLGVALEDGHQVVYSTDPTARANQLAPLDLEVVGGDLIVTASNAPGVARGDRIVSIGGVPTAELLAHERATRSGSPGRRELVAAFGLLGLDSPTAFGVERFDGTSASVVITPQDTSLALSTWERPPGALDSLGAPDVYYVSLSSEATRGVNARAIAAAAKQHRAIILDLRGYPGFEAYTIAAALLPSSSVGCELRVPHVSRRGEFARDLQQQTIASFAPPDGEPFTGPMAVLIGPSTQSAAEHLAFFFVTGQAGHRATLVGRPSSGANGNMTGAWLPSGLGFTFTGMEVRHPGGGRFHGLGLQPDVPVEPTRADIAAGVDSVLARAIATVSP